MCSKIAVVGALATFTFLSMPAVADEVTNLGPVGPTSQFLPQSAAVG